MTSRADLTDVADRLAGVAEDLARLARELEDRPTARAPTATNVLAIPFYFVADHDRRNVTRKVFAHYANVAAELDLAVVGLGSEGKLSRTLFAQHFPADNYREYPQPASRMTGAGNAVLRAKFDETVRAARPFNPARVFIIGSDDLIDSGFFAAALASDADLVGIGSGPPDAVRIVRLARREVHYWHGHYPNAPDLQCCGGGFGFSRRLLDEWDFAPFARPGDEVGIERRAREEGFTIEGLPAGADTFRFHAVKTERAVLNGWAQVARVGPVKAPPSAFADFSRRWDIL